MPAAAATAARKHEKTGDRGIALFYDDAQNLYGRPRPIWRDLGIHVTGGRTIALQRSYRTSRPIATFAFNVLLGPPTRAAPPPEREGSRISSLCARAISSPRRTAGA